MAWWASRVVAGVALGSGSPFQRSDARRRDSRLRRALPLVLSNAARFTAPVDPALLRAVYARRDHVFGPFDVREIEIVRSDGIMSPKQTDVLSRADLRP